MPKLSKESLTVLRDIFHGPGVGGLPYGVVIDVQQFVLESLAAEGLEPAPATPTTPA